MRTVSLRDKLLQNAIMRNLICKEAKSRLDCKVLFLLFQLLIKEAILLYATIAVDQVRQRLKVQEVKSNHAQLLGLCICITFVCLARGDDDIEQVVYSHKILKRD